MGPSVKFVSPNKGLISKKNWGSIFFRRKNDQTEGGFEGGLAKDHTFSHFFSNPSFNRIVDTPCSCGHFEMRLTQVGLLVPKL